MLDEGMWLDATPLRGFVQAEPFEGLPGSETTEVRLLYDDEAIYVGVVLHDRDPSLIVTTDTRRDAGLDDMDSFQMIFDTFHDRQNGFVFGTNVAGSSTTRRCATRVNRKTTGMAAGKCKPAMSPTGWTAEFRIPLRTLRYGPRTADLGRELPSRAFSGRASGRTGRRSSGCTSSTD